MTNSGQVVTVQVPKTVGSFKAGLVLAIRLTMLAGRVNPDLQGALLPSLDKRRWANTSSL